MAVAIHSSRSGGVIARLVAFALILTTLPAAWLLGAASASAEDSPGTVTRTDDSERTFTALAEEPEGGLQVVVNERGLISRSIGAVGTSSYGPVALTVDKPTGATVRKAFLAFASRGNSFRPLTVSPLLEGEPVALLNETPSLIGAYNYFTEVTSIVKPAIDAATSGAVSVELTETDPYYHEASVLVVIYDDPAVTSPQSVTLLYGALNPQGDTYGVTLTEPVDKSDPATHMEMSLAISYSWQEYGAPQYSTIDVNQTRVTTAAGGSEDGYPGNGGLVTAGGRGDNADNPTDPYALPTGARSDDELYDLLPFVEDGDTRLTVETTNPSNDDNVFLATLTMNPPVRSISTDGDTMVADPEVQDVPLGLDARWTVEPPSGVSTFFDAFGARILAGPNAGKDFASGCLDVLCENFSLEAVDTYLRPGPDFALGTDTVRLWWDTDADGVQDIEEEQFATVAVRWIEPVHAVAMGDSFSSGEGVDPYDDGTDDEYDWFGADRNQCHRSAYAYGRLTKPAGYDDALPTYIGGPADVQVDFVACSGATTEDVREGGGPQYTSEGASQIDQGALGVDSDFVTISIGGNDVGFADVVTNCAVNGCFDPDSQVNGTQVLDFAEARLAALPAKLDRVLEQIKGKAPNASVILLGYPHLFPSTYEGAGDCLKLKLWDEASQRWMNQKGDDVNVIMSAAAARAGVHYLSPIDKFDGHEICGADGEWLAGITAPNVHDQFGGGWGPGPGTGSFHPNRTGQAEGYAALVNEFLADRAAADAPTNQAGLPLNPVPQTWLHRSFSVEVADTSTTGPLELSQVPDVAATACYAGAGLVGVGQDSRLWAPGFDPGSQVRVTWEAMDGSTALLDTVTASAAGQVATLVRPPATAAVDSYARIKVRGTNPDGGDHEGTHLVGVAHACDTSGYEVSGFHGPVQNAPVLNQMNAGRAVPLIFGLGGNHGLDIFAAGSPSSGSVDCASGVTVDPVEETLAAGSSSLTYDSESGRYHYVWKTKADWAGTCRRLTLTFNDGTTRDALFSFW